MSNPNLHPVRYRRLTSDYQRLQKLANNSPFIHIESAKGSPPHEYVVRYTCKGIVDLGVLGPVYGENHKVLIELPREYPVKEPRMRWLTDIFHPNINRSGTHVCIDAWYPSKFLDDLCIMLGRMIQYQNYNPYSPLDMEIAAWSVQNAHLLPVDTRPLQYGQSDDSSVDSFDINFLD